MGGVISYILLAGFPPFYDDDQAELFAMIKRGSFSFPSPYWDNVSPEAKDFVGKMLTVDPRSRPSADQLLKHKYITGVKESDLEEHDLHGAAVEMKKLKARRRFKGAAKAVI